MGRAKQDLEDAVVIGEDDIGRQHEYVHGVEEPARDQLYRLAGNNHHDARDYSQHWLGCVPLGFDKNGDGSWQHQ